MRKKYSALYACRNILQIVADMRMHGGPVTLTVAGEPVATLAPFIHPPKPAEVPQCRTREEVAAHDAQYAHLPMSERKFMVYTTGAVVDYETAVAIGIVESDIPSPMPTPSLAPEIDTTVSDDFEPMDEELTDEELIAAGFTREAA